MDTNLNLILRLPRLTLDQADEVFDIYGPNAVITITPDGTIVTIPASAGAEDLD